MRLDARSVRVLLMFGACLCPLISAHAQLPGSPAEAGLDSPYYELQGKLTLHDGQEVRSARGLELEQRVCAKYNQLVDADARSGMSRLEAAKALAPTLARTDVNVNRCRLYSSTR